jgi:hypothetical protein
VVDTDARAGSTGYALWPPPERLEPSDGYAR